MAEGEPKSAYELAMERLRKKDAEEGVEHRPLTDEQKTAIADVRSQYEAKLADLEIRHEPVSLASLVEERDGKIEKIRAGEIEGA